MLQDNMNRQNNHALANNHFFHPIHTTASEDLWQLPHHATSSDLEHLGENPHQVLFNSWSSSEDAIPAVPHPSTSTIQRRTQGESPQPERQRSPLGETTNTMRRYM